MMSQPFDLLGILDRFQVNTHSQTYTLGLRAFASMRAGNTLDAVSHAHAAVRESLGRNDHTERAIACACLGAIYALQGNFVESARLAEDCYRIFNQLADKANAATAKLLLATVYQLHVETLSRSIAGLLHDAQAFSQEIESRALSKGQIDTAEEYHQQFLEFGEQVRRARWIPALPHTLPLVWLPVINFMPADPDTQGVEPVAFMEPVVFVLKSRADVELEASGDIDPGTAQDQLYTARPLPSPDDTRPGQVRPPRLRPSARYAAIKVDPDSAHAAGLDPEDYLLVRPLSSAERAELLKQADEGISGIYFQLNDDGEVEVVKAIPPKFVGEAEVRMLVAQVDAVLRRIS